MTERDQVYLVTLAGAAIGGAIGYFFFTGKGRQLREQLEPAVENLAEELTRFRGTLLKAATVANDGWGLMNEVVGEVRSWSSSTPSELKQTRPF